MIRGRFVLAGVTAALATTMVLAPSAMADDPVVPRPNAPCSAQLANAKTENFNPKPGEEGTHLACQKTPNGYVWSVRPLALPFTKVLTLGSGNQGELRSALFSGRKRGDGQYALNYPSTWVGTPQSPDAQCIAEQTPLLSESIYGSPTAEAGAPVNL